ncbi:2,3-bisphosphoglycerate-independent phosphoglycerate mutase [Oceanicoccus sagamiensis]|uniref:2,3-bisphosphoglycerate-independent phosphoglycerate mutase n=1 Tax=Oceanicoccus sagamiensis TaxID=716816 RepID=A0A1X9NHY8_9GAMM|nr:2,3-bisphosphoglycerate-independent phosphoglycerate mutase [Oceanicoccus sagamiensis]ARN73603.1 phosphoglycerate mutase (2,3-diphosphoglycerate-independent) [Oceanicoccus sagamiensis]
MANSTGKKPVVLLILDGWGHREAPEDNAIYNANTPNWDRLWNEQPKTLISSSGMSVGLPDGQMGNSEVGHMSLGAGRIVYQNISRIDKAIADGDFFENSTYIDAIDKAVSSGKAVHLFGLLSPGGVHSHENHILAMIDMAAKRGAEQVYLHAFLDGRDTPPRSAQSSLQAMDNKFAEYGCGRVASLIGRYYAMDRDNRWDRVQLAYDMLTEAKADYRFDNAIDGLNAAYQRDENDEFVSATLIQSADQPSATINDGDTVIFMNFRADRAREITRAFVEADFDGFTRNKTPALASFVTTTEYAADINAPSAFPPEKVTNSFGELMEANDKKQLRIAETEKYAHVTFFFSGGREDLYQGEDRVLVPSPDVATYDLKPEMSAPEVTDKLVAAISSGEYDTIICNYANGDMVGHTGSYEAALKAAEAIDESVRRVSEAVLSVGGDCLITADHGNCEQMLDYDSGQAHTQHTTELVPFIYVGNKTVTMQQDGGKLADVAPTLLTLMNLEQPAEMTGNSLLTVK